jgi:hypothetical protein
MQSIYGKLQSFTGKMQSKAIKSRKYGILRAAKTLGLLGFFFRTLSENKNP